MNEWVYRRLLGLYPAAFRHDYGEMMVADFRTLRAAAGGGGLRFWFKMLQDVTWSAFQERFNAHGGLTMYPDTIDRFQILAPVGEGSIASVFRAYDPSTRREVALKVVSASVVTARFGNAEPYFRSLQHEARVLQSLAHAAIPAVYTFAAEEDYAYLAMEYVEGRSLLEVLDACAQPIGEARLVLWGQKVCDMLSYIHEAGYIYRDMKPSNILVGAMQQLFVVDWGICENYIYQPEFVKIGTEGYSPPEQYKGQGDPRSDIYALGATLHHLATGEDPRLRPPFTFASVQAVNPALSDAFAAVVDKAVHYNGDDRFQSAAEMHAALTAC